MLRPRPGAEATRTVDLSLIFPEELGEAPEPCERLLGDALQGNSGHFTREDGVEETWRIVQPLLDAPPPVEPSKPGTWGAGRRRQAASRASPLAPPLATFTRDAGEAVSGLACQAEGAEGLGGTYLILDS